MYMYLLTSRHFQGLFLMASSAYNPSASRQGMDVLLLPAVQGHLMPADESSLVFLVCTEKHRNLNQRHSRLPRHKMIYSTYLNIMTWTLLLDFFLRLGPQMSLVAMAPVQGNRLIHPCEIQQSPIAKITRRSLFGIAAVVWCLDPSFRQHQKAPVSRR